MRPIVVVGSINIDLCMRVPAWAQPGETLAATDFSIGLGGKGANQAVAASRLGGSVRMIGAVGQDVFGSDATARLQAEGVECFLLEATGLNTGLAMVDVTPDGQNAIRVAAGANGALTAEVVRSHAEVFKGAAVVLLQNEIGLAASLEAARLGRAAGALVIMDPGPAPIPVWSVAEVAAFDVLTPNATEVEAFLGTVPETLDDARSSAVRLHRSGLAGAFVTMGSLGVAWSFGEAAGARPATSVTAVDTVAAGDTFNGSLAQAIAEGRPLIEAIDQSLDAAALATLRSGAAASAPTRDELTAFRRGRGHKMTSAV